MVYHNSNIDTCILSGIRHTLYANDAERIWWYMVAFPHMTGRNSFRI